MASFGRHRRLADSDDSDDEHTVTRNVLTTAKASDLCPKPHRLLAQNGGFTAMEDMSTLSALDYVDLRGNALKSVQGLSSNSRMKTLNVKQNKLSNVDHILKTGALQILDISDNEFVTTEWLPRAAFAGNLVALMARGNKLVTLEGLACLRGLQTLVLSDNQIEDISAVTQLVSLTKLSASKNCIRVIPDSITNLHNLRELRLAHNRLAVLPSKETLARLTSLKIFDIGHNRIASVDNLAACSGALIQLNVAGNPAGQNKINFADYLQKLCPKLEIIDGRRVAGGRRKLRVNRQRLEAGMPLEPERKFVRPPSAYYVQKAKENKGDVAVTEKSLQGSALKGTQDAAEKDVVKRKVRSHASLEAPDNEYSRITKKVRPSIPEEDDNDALDATQFVAMAKTNATPPAKDDSRVADKKENKQKSSRRKLGATAERQEHLVEFGSGGASKW